MKNREVINSYIDKWIEDYNNRQRPVGIMKMAV